MKAGGGRISVLFPPFLGKIDLVCDFSESICQFFSGGSIAISIVVWYNFHIQLQIHLLDGG
jgi:hypothetical protein